jgi:hypothetical protein
MGVIPASPVSGATVSGYVMEKRWFMGDSFLKTADFIMYFYYYTIYYIVCQGSAICIFAYRRKIPMTSTLFSR